MRVFKWLSWIVSIAVGVIFKVYTEISIFSWAKDKYDSFFIPFISATPTFMSESQRWDFY